MGKDNDPFSSGAGNEDESFVIPHSNSNRQKM